MIFKEIELSEALRIIGEGNPDKNLYICSIGQLSRSDAAKQMNVNFPKPFFIGTPCTHRPSFVLSRNLIYLLILPVPLFSAHRQTFETNRPLHSLPHRLLH